MLDCTALPHITSLSGWDSSRTADLLPVLDNTQPDLPNTGMPQFLQIISAACANSFRDPLGQMHSPGKRVWLGASVCQTNPSCHRGPGSLSAARINWGGSDSCQNTKPARGIYRCRSCIKPIACFSTLERIRYNSVFPGNKIQHSQPPVRQITPMVLQLQVPAPWTMGPWEAKAVQQICAC